MFESFSKLCCSLEPTVKINLSPFFVQHEPSVEVVYDTWLSVPIPMLNRQALRERTEFEALWASTVCARPVEVTNLWLEPACH